MATSALPDVIDPAALGYDDPALTRPDTWSISGSEFLTGYVLLAVAVTVVTAVTVRSRRAHAAVP